MIQNKPEISVIIPVYKVERYIHTCIDSVLQQTFQNFEIILVDDSSPDKCPEICDMYSRRDSRIKVIHKSKNEGLGFARNTGLDAASGKYVCFIDSDDYIALNTLEYCLEIAKKEKADEVRYLFDRFQCDEESHPDVIDPIGDYIVASGADRIDPILNVIAPVLSRQTMTAETTSSSCTALYRREVIESNHIRFFSEREVLSEDYIFSVDFAFFCKRIVYTSNKFYKYRSNPSSLSRTFRADRIEKAVFFSSFLERRLKDYGYDDSEIYVMGFTIGEMRTYNRLIFRSDMPLSRKKEMFYKCLDNDYIRKIQKFYPIKKLSVMQRIAFRLHISRHFYASYLITHLRDFWKKIERHPQYG